MSLFRQILQVLIGLLLLAGVLFIGTVAFIAALSLIAVGLAAYWLRERRMLNAPEVMFDDLHLRRRESEQSTRVIEAEYEEITEEKRASGDDSRAE